MIDLYAHNKTAYQAAIDMLSRTGKAAVIHPTGTGKSFVAFRLCQERADARIVWLSPSEYIWRTQLANLRAAGGSRPENVAFLTYARLMLLTVEERAALRPEIVILDEFHRCGAQEWGKGVRALLEDFPDALLLGLTATPIRYLDGQRDMADELFDGCVAHEMTLSEAIMRGILPAPKYVLSLYAYQKELDRYRRRARKTGGAARQTAEQYLECLRRRLEEADGIEHIFEKHLPDRQGKYLIFCADYEHLQKMRGCAGEWFSRIDAKPHIYEVYAENAKAKETFHRFQADESPHLKLLYCIDMLNEGVHVEGLDGVILCRTTVSPIVYKQQIGRALSASGGKTPVIFDLVNNVDNLYSISALRKEMEAVVSYYANEHRESEIARDGFELVDEVRECRELFERLEETLSAPWDMMYGEACAYYRAHGDLNIPKRYRTEANLALGSWVQTQRRVRQGSCAGVLTEERVAKLDAIGMIWQSPQETGWENAYAHAKAYREEHGDLNVPARYICVDGFRLGSWICNRRADYAKARKRSGLTKEQIRRLNELGMIWNRVDFGFERGYALAARYAAAYGHLRVPAGYVDGDGFKLGAWLNNQRSKRDALSAERRERLEHLGLCWENRHEEQWERAYQEAVRYHSLHKDLQIPLTYESDGIRLGRWLRRQQAQYAQGKLSEEHACRLFALGMALPQKTSWDKRYIEAKAYYEANGHLSPSPTQATEASLYHWLKAQRQAFGQGRLTPAQTKALQALGVPLESPAKSAWKQRFAQAAACYDPLLGKLLTEDHVLAAWFRRQKEAAEQGRLKPWQMELWRTLPVPADEWERRFQQARAYFDEHGSLNVPSGPLWQWLRKQRRVYWGQEDGKLSEEQIHRLEEIGMEWTTVYDRRWQAGYAAASQYYRQHGRLDVHSGYVTEQGYPLGSWLYEQKRRYQAGKLEARRLKALKAIHTPWLLTGNTETQGQMR